MQTANPDNKQIARARIAVYRFLIAALDQPSKQQHEWMQGDGFREPLKELCELFGIEPPETELVPGSFAEHESRYLACFEVGLPEPPVVLLASHYNRREPTPRIIHEHVLLYRRFGVQVPPGSDEPADHLLGQLAFLVRLDELLESAVIEPRSILRARHDFLSRHLGWVSLALETAQDRGLPPLYLTLFRVLATALEQDLQLTGLALADLPRENA